MWHQQLRIQQMWLKEILPLRLPAIILQYKKLSLIFLSPYVQQSTSSLVSPGPKLDESEYVQTANSTSQSQRYLLPEYTTGFLLAKDVSLTFRGLNSSHSRHAVQLSTTGSFYAGFGPFVASSSFSYAHASSHLRVYSVSNGLHIDIPGAQIIGYYTSVLPKFPKVPDRK